jgi:hypothetical protein
MRKLGKWAQQKHDDQVKVDESDATHHEQAETAKQTKASTGVAEAHAVHVAKREEKLRRK